MARPGLKLGATLACKKCGKDYYVSPSRVGKSRFCSKACYDAEQTGERRTTNCLRCGREFQAAKDHGKWPKFCGLECRNFGAPQPSWKECPTCGGNFLATRSSHETDDGLRIYCSFKCSKEGLKRGHMRACICCGKEFYMNPAKARRSKEENCCSAECNNQFYKEERSPGWKGGRFLDVNSGTTRVRLKREGFVCPYIGEHRVVASRSIGRMLEPYEPIMHINNVKTDNRPENLFICGSYSEMAKRMQGSLPWPKRSNLKRYR